MQDIYGTALRLAFQAGTEDLSLGFAIGGRGTAMMKGVPKRAVAMMAGRHMLVVDGWKIGWGFFFFFFWND